MKRIFTLLFCGLSAIGFSQSSTVVISQFYPGGGSSSATVTYTNDYAEIHNVSSVSQDISGFSLQYGSATGNFGNSATAIFTFAAGTVLAPGQYYLVQLGTAGTGGAALPVTPDASSTNISAGASSGKVALVNNATALGCGATATPCTLPGSTTIVDVLSYGASNNAEGDAPANGGVALTSNQYGLVRKLSGCQDTNNNNNDFDAVQNPVPRNTATTAAICSALPLNLTAFTASLRAGVATLNWTSQNETNVKGFAVEKSLDGRTYSEIAFVNATNRATTSEYSVADNKLKAGANYYRLKMVDANGSSRYSNVVVLSNKAGIKTELFPNPAVNTLTVSHDKTNAGAVIRILSLEGRQLKTITVQSGAMQTSINVNDLVTGNYLMVFESNGEKSVSKFAKQ